MQYSFKGKVYDLPQQEIETLKRKLGISENEAVDVYLDDHNICINETAEELARKSKANGVQKEMTRCKSAKKADRKRERKPDPTKEEIISICKSKGGTSIVSVVVTIFGLVQIMIPIIFTGKLIGSTIEVFDYRPVDVFLPSPHRFLLG